MGPEDFTGFISECVARLTQAGFDADAFETAKWAGVACLSVIGLSIAAGFAARIWRKDATIEVPITENQFRWLLYIGALLIALPVMTKVTAEIAPLEFESTDRAYAQEICREGLNDTTQAAALRASEAKLTARLDQMAFELAALRDATPSNGELFEQSIETLIDPEILGTPVSIFYRPARRDAARGIAARLEEVGAGVALRASDLSETSRATTALPGDLVILYDERGAQSERAIIDLLRDAELDVTDSVGVRSLSGTPVQLLMY
ncbi:MAG: hypothetical protein AAFY38_16630 [Pseudomonadota bacterium]